MSLDENRQLLRRFITEMINQQDVALADAVIAPDCVFHMGSRTVQGREQFKQVLTGFFTAFPDMQGTIDDLVAEGDKVVVHFHWQGTHRGAFLGVPATGKPVAYGGMALTRVVGGQIVEDWSIEDTLGLFQQLGVVPTPGAAPA